MTKSYRFEDLVDVPALQRLTDNLYAATGIPSAIIGMDGRILTGSGWQRICTHFHRRNPEIELECIASDTAIRREIEAGEEFAIYECPRGLVDASSPVVIEGEHVANVFAGQLFMTPPEETKEAFFRETARRYGFDEEAYLSAYREIPVLPEEKFRPTLTFLSGLAKLVASLGLARLKEMEAVERFNQVAEATSELIWEVDAHGLYTYVSPGSESLIGYSYSDLVGKRHLYDLHPEEGREGFKRLILAFMEEGHSTFSLTKPVQTRDGSILWMETKGIPLVGKEERVRGFRGFDKDITARRRQEEESELEKRRLQTIIRTALDGFMVVDPEMRILDVNEKAGEILGYSREELLRMSIDEIEAVMTREDIARINSRMMKEGEARFESRHRRRDGSIIDVEVSIQHQTLEGDRFVSFFRDITQRKSAEAEREQLQERLAHSQKMEAIGTLAGGIAHDFNNILAVIMGNTEASIRSLHGDSPVLENLREIMVASTRARDLVQQILAFARRSEKRVFPVDVDLLFSESMKFLGSIIPKNICIETQVNLEDQKTVVADPTELYQVIMNLCTNAYQAMAHLESGNLRVSLNSVSGGTRDSEGNQDLPDGDYIRLDVEDNGPGIDDETQSRIFEPYFTTKGLGKGTGLGLALVHGIVAGLGGVVTVRSTPGTGTLFSVYLPIGKAEEACVSEAAVELPASGAGRILFVDDEPSLVRLGRKMLEDLGYRVMGVTDPREALRIFKKDPAGFDLIVTDQTMPDLTGLELIRKAKAIRPEVPSVICTGYSGLIDEAGARQEGIDAFVQKPYDRALLASSIAEALADRS